MQIENKQTDEQRLIALNFAFVKFIGGSYFDLKTKNKLTELDLYSFKGNTIPEELRDQQSRSVAEIVQSAEVLVENPAFKIFFNNPEVGRQVADKSILSLIKKLERLIEFNSGFYKKHNIDMPIAHKEVRKILKTIFSTELFITGETVYKILALFNMYGVFHSFCTQMVPVGLEFDFADIDEEEELRQGLRNRLIDAFAPEPLKSVITTVDKEKFVEGNKWISNDKETRIKIANGLFKHIKEYLSQHKGERVSIIEPGAGNGEFTAILAELIYNHEVTRSRVNLILKEYSPNMINEGKNKFARLKKSIATEQDIDQNDVDLGIHYICGSAETPLETQIKVIASYVKDQDEKNLENIFQLTLDEAKKLLSQIKDTKIIGAVSTYTLGAMGESSRNIIQQLLKEVSTQGQITLVDFAHSPPNEYINRYIPDPKEKEKVIRRKIIFDKLAPLGFAQGLEINFGIWEHDILQIWKVVHQIIETGQDVNMTTNADLKPFSIIPVGLGADKDTLQAYATTGYWELTVQMTGLADPEQKIEVPEHNLE